MAAQTAIPWTDATFNPWLGCTRVSPACDHCYAAALSWRTGRRDRRGLDLWEPRAERLRTTPHYWRQPLRWNADATLEGTRRRVFCASMADIFDNRAPAAWRADLWRLIRATPALDWQLLTKRPQNIAGMLPPEWGDGWPNVWLGTTTENQDEAARRIPHLIAIPATLRFLSVEPMLEAMNLVPWLDELHWLIVGGESGVGNRSRSMHPGWVRDLRDQAQSIGVAFFLKQIGSNRSLWPGVRQLKGQDPTEWPADLRVREYPRARTQDMGLP
jgi:protein gp37